MAVAARAIDVTEELSRAAERADVETLARLLPRVIDINAGNRHGTTALMRAASCGHARIVRLLLLHGADPNVTRNDKFTALALAAFFGHTETVKVLMEFGARTDDVTRSGASARTWATARTFTDVARCLDTPTPVTTQPQPQPRIEVQRNPARSRSLTLGVIATMILISCGGLGALVLRSSEAHDLPAVPSQPPPKVEPPKVETTMTAPQPEPPTPKPVVNEAPVAPKTANVVRPPLKKIREARSVTVLSEKPVEEPAERVQVSAPPPPPVTKPKLNSPKPAALSSQVIAPTKKAKVIQWP